MSWEVGVDASTSHLERKFSIKATRLIDTPVKRCIQLASKLKCQLWYRQKQLHQIRFSWENEQGSSPETECIKHLILAVVSHRGMVTSLETGAAPNEYQALSQTTYPLAYSSSQQSCELGGTLTPIVQIRKLRLGKFKNFSEVTWLSSTPEGLGRIFGRWVSACGVSI